MTSVRALNAKYNENLRLIELILGRGITTGDQLYRLGKTLFGTRFKGVYTDRDKLPKLKDGECLIVNRKTGEHWVAMANLIGRRGIRTYDSFNRQSYLGGYRSGDVDGKPDQMVYESNCGQRSLSWLTTVLSK
jgi:hypothetical protein